MGVVPTLDEVDGGHKPLGWVRMCSRLIGSSPRVAEKLSHIELSWA